MAPESVPAPTLASIAVRLGISRTTVSNAFNRPDQLSRELRSTIISAAAQLGYFGPQLTARALRTKEFGAVGVLLGEPAGALADPASTQFFDGLAAAAKADGCALLLPDTAVRSAAAAFIGYRTRPDDPRIQAVLLRKEPLVLVDTPRSAHPTRAYWVGIDEFRAGMRAGQYLHALGHRRIGVLTRGGSESQRTTGLLAGVNGGPQTPIVRCQDEISAAVGTAMLLKRYRGLTAIACSSDALAFGALRVVNDHHPGRISVIGVDDAPGASSLGLTTVHQPIDEKAHVAWGLLGAQQPISPRVLPTRLVIRSSTYQRSDELNTSEENSGYGVGQAVSAASL